ncbi:MAG TPA: hypothetical protein VMI54_22795 [Polyangiaceae bacterium]|nr:hypothetical protein [Polyangiaceae bacterium]
MTTNGARKTDVDQAKREVEHAERMLSKRLHEAGVAGNRTLDRALSLGEPLLVGAVAVAGVVWLVSLLRRPRRRPLFETAPARPSIVKEALRAATLALASTAARRVGEHFLLAEAAPQSTSTGRKVPTQHPTPARP